MNDSASIAPSKAPLAPGAIGRLTHEMVTAGDWQGVLDLLRSQPADRLRPGLFVRAVEAALAVRDPEALAWAVRLVIVAELPHRIRAAAAARLAATGNAQQAWAVLCCDPATVWDIEARGPVGGTLAAIRLDARADPTVRDAARALERRLSGARAEETERAIFAHPDPGPLVLPALSPRLRLAPGVDPAFADLALGLAARAEQELREEDTPQVVVHRDVFVNRHGHIWRPDGGVLGMLVTSLPGSARAAMTVAPRIPAGVLATGVTNNLHHWLNGYLPSFAWRFAPGVPRSLPILVRDDAAPFQTASLDLLAGPDLPVLPVGEACRVDVLYSVTHRTGRAEAGSPAAALHDRIAAAADAASSLPPPGGPRLYISRRDAALRPMENEAEFEAVLEAMGFVAVMMSRLPFAEQVRAVRAASVIVAPHGAGLALLALARPGVKVFELMPAMPRSLLVRLCMTRISRLRGHPHLAWVEPCDELTGRWRVSIPEAVAALEEFLADPPGPEEASVPLRLR
ncbi:glycosyltransferase family 61 protein [Neoroseomonas soli]|uniref:Glycosyltransferase family 61 protein n=1 Tax=Neoroseomonas soli TaxID=1081025 RepID=A0A9X9X0X9_9PROT|nr:glycosyltransferase 61 family protein [Neoroseomonas soli]MBR0673058.1 glycosyltransferase family 61 protein [Neoroseomonas soli]